MDTTLQDNLPDSDSESRELSLTLCLGANCGQRRETLEEALAWLSTRLAHFRCSDIYETPAYGYDGAPYLNTVAVGTLKYSLSQFEAECKRYELEHGRDADARRLNLVPIDIDIVIAGTKILRPGDYRCSFFQIGYSKVNTVISG